MLKSFGFTGGSLNKIDVKGRLNIPAQMRRVLAPDAYDEVVISLGREGHLSLFNKNYWQNTILQNFIDKADNASGPKEWVIIQRDIQQLSKNSHMSTVDSQGRITIPQWLLDKVGINKDALVIGSIDRINVWAPEKFEAWNEIIDEDSTSSGVYI